MKLTPVYHKQDKTYRVCYIPGGYWQAQRSDGAKGTRTIDPWQPLAMRVDTQDEALQIMYERKPLIK